MPSIHRLPHFELPSPPMASTEAVSSARLRPYCTDDRDSVTQLLHELPDIYPGADQWLLKRLTDVASGLAFCTVAERNDQVVGVTIQAPKPLSQRKLCTLFVASEFRRQRIGSSLLLHAQAGWQQAGV